MELKQRVINYDMLIDKLITKDVQLTACNDDQYFVFEDVLYQVYFIPVIKVFKFRCTVYLESENRTGVSILEVGWIFSLNVPMRQKK